MREARVGATNVPGNIGMPPGEPLDVHLVNDRLVQLSTEWTITLPVIGGVNDDRLRHVRRVVCVVSLQIVTAQRVRKNSGIPLDSTSDGPGVRIDQELRRVAPKPVCRVPGTMHTEPIPL